MAQLTATSIENEAIVIRRATAADAEACGKICFDAFGALAAKHNFPPDLPAPEVGVGLLSVMFSTHRSIVSWLNRVGG